MKDALAGLVRQVQVWDQDYVRVLTNGLDVRFDLLRADSIYFERSRFAAAFPVVAFPSSFHGLLFN